jgi:hypothetical protein
VHYPHAGKNYRYRPNQNKRRLPDVFILRLRLDYFALL